MRLYDTYDYVIIGSGSAGSAIANRLGEDYRLRILVLEAGPADSSFLLKMPAGFASLGETSPYNWRYETVPQVHCNNRRMYWPRGKTLGGSSSINAMLYVRGHAWDYDHWRQLGNEGWSYEDVLPFFRKAENNERLKDDFHGTGGPLNVAEQPTPLPINEAFVQAGVQAGLPRFSPRQADVLFVVGTISHKMAPVLKRIYEQMTEPKWVVAFGVCTCTGGFYDNYATVQGIDTTRTFLPSARSWAAALVQSSSSVPVPMMIRSGVPLLSSRM